MREQCVACDRPMVNGEPYYNDVGGGVIHVRCTGPRESFINAKGEPLGADEPLPIAMVWNKKD